MSWSSPLFASGSRPSFSTTKWHPDTRSIKGCGNVIPVCPARFSQYHLLQRFCTIWCEIHLVVKDTITAACNKLPRAPIGQDTDWVTDEVRNLSKKKEAWVHLCNNTSIALQWDLTSTAERRRHWQFYTPHPVHSPKPSLLAHLKTQWSLCPRFSTWVAQCPKTVVTVLRCHPGLSKPRRHLALSTKGCGCRRGSRLSLCSMSSLLSSSQIPYMN